ncbi:MAG TPA: hypothetical protein DIW30_01850 [Bacteroidales bacterium]|nr:hypothetical protein [Bacteroidales bacterium]
MTDFSIKVRFDDTGISTTPSASFPTLKIRGKNLYICAPTGMLRATDKVKFARYVSSSNSHWVKKNGVETGEKACRKHTGWIRPKSPNNLQDDLVQMSMELDKKLSTAETEFWRLYVWANEDNEGTMDWMPYIAESLYMVMISKLLYKSSYKGVHFDSLQGLFVDDNGNDVYVTFVDLFGKKLGVCIERNGVQITDYMPFACTFTLGRIDEIPHDDHIMIAKSLSLFHSPKHLMSLRNYMKIRQSKNQTQTAEDDGQ